MAVVVLMYHHTPDGAPEGFYDVALGVFRDQIAAMRDAGVSFIKFTDCDRPEYVEHGVHVALTFDDGHASNAEAFRDLADKRLTPMAFIVRDWSTRDKRYLSASALGDLKDICELGGHGATHRALSTLSDAELADELAASRDYVQAVTEHPRDRDGSARRPRGPARTRRRRTRGLHARRQFPAAAASPARARRQPHLRQQDTRRTSAVALGSGERAALDATARPLRRDCIGPAADGRQALWRVDGAGEVKLRRRRAGRAKLLHLGEDRAHTVVDRIAGLETTQVPGL